LFDVDVFCALVIFVVFDMKSDSGVANDFSRYPTDALQGQDFVGVVAKFAILRPIDQTSGLSFEFEIRLAWINFPLRLRVVIFSGAAI
jgi:hypothetical protein